MTVKELLELGLLSRHQPLRFINDNNQMSRGGERNLGRLEYSSIPNENSKDYEVYLRVKDLDVLFMWTEVSEEIVEEDNPIIVTVSMNKETEENGRYKPYKKRTIRCLDNGKIYNSVKEVAEDLNLNAKQINNHLSGTTRSAGGYHLVELYDL